MRMDVARPFRSSAGAHCHETLRFPMVRAGPERTAGFGGVFGARRAEPARRAERVAFCFGSGFARTLTGLGTFAAAFGAGLAAFAGRRAALGRGGFPFGFHTPASPSYTSPHLPHVCWQSQSSAASSARTLRRPAKSASRLAATISARGSSR